MMEMKNMKAHAHVIRSQPHIFRFFLRLVDILDFFLSSRISLQNVLPQFSNSSPEGQRTAFQEFI